MFVLTQDVRQNPKCDTHFPSFMEGVHSNKQKYLHAVSDYKKRVEFRLVVSYFFSRFYTVFVSYFSQVIQSPFLKF